MFFADLWCMTLLNNNNTLNNQLTLSEPLHHLFDAVTAIAVQGYDESRRVIYWNKGSESLYGFTREEALGHKLEDLIIPAPLKTEVIDGIKIGLTRVKKYLLLKLP